MPDSPLDLDWTEEFEWYDEIAVARVCAPDRAVSRASVRDMLSGAGDFPRAGERVPVSCELALSPTNGTYVDVEALVHIACGHALLAAKELGKSAETMRANLLDLENRVDLVPPGDERLRPLCQVNLDEERWRVMEHPLRVPDRRGYYAPLATGAIIARVRQLLPAGYTQYLDHALRLVQDEIASDRWGENYYDVTDRAKMVSGLATEDMPLPAAFLHDDMNLYDSPLAGRNYFGRAENESARELWSGHIKFYWDDGVLGDPDDPEMADIWNAAGISTAATAAYLRYHWIAGPFSAGANTMSDAFSDVLDRIQLATVALMVAGVAGESAQGDEGKRAQVAHTILRGFHAAMDIEIDEAHEFAMIDGVELTPYGDVDIDEQLRRMPYAPTQAWIDLINWILEPIEFDAGDEWKRFARAIANPGLSGMDAFLTEPAQDRKILRMDWTDIDDEVIEQIFGDLFFAWTVRGTDTTPA